MREVEKNVYLPRDKIDEIKRRRFRSILKYVYDNSPFYRRLFKENGVDIESIKELQI